MIIDGRVGNVFVDDEQFIKTVDDWIRTSLVSFVYVFKYIIIIPF